MSSTPPPHQTEKPAHYTYLKEFRVNQCPLFLQHKCTQHRPFTCFYWHFSNQRRRRPVRKRDGTFNYSADAYCTKYDETTGICQIGDDCPYIHRNTGDTERRYHLRYYKTGTCIHETDSRGNCVKNGPHCAFAHGSDDLRPPVYDIREQQGDNNQDGNGDHLPRSDVVNLAEKIVNEDPKWLDSNYVLANYKTDVCKRPPRLCRQGYACPQYHNPKDRRRNPKKFKYRSTPCPNVKQGDDWKDPSCCEKGDGCSFCHTRTEQQFHPEIYKSTKCHDMSQTGYCPRGPFCAFAHVEQEIRVLDDDITLGENDIATTINNTEDDKLNFKMSENEVKREAAAAAYAAIANDTLNNSNMWNPGANDVAALMGEMNILDSVLPGNEHLISRSFPSRLSPVSKHRSGSLSGPRNDLGFSYSKAIGSERYLAEGNTSMGNPFGNISNSWSRNTGIDSPFNNAGSPAPLVKPGSYTSDSYYQPKATVASVIGNALDDNSAVGNTGVDRKEIQRIWNTDSGGVSVTSHDNLFPKSSPLSIPHYGHLGGDRYGAAGNSLPSGSPSLFGDSMAAVSASSFPNMGTLTMKNAATDGMVSMGEFQRMQHKCMQWEDSWNQAKQACEAWKKEATEATDRAVMAEKREKMVFEKLHIAEQRMERMKAAGGSSPNTGSNEIVLKECSFLHQHFDQLDLKDKPLEVLRELQKRYKTDLDAVEKYIWEGLWQHQK